VVLKVSPYLKFYSKQEVPNDSWEEWTAAYDRAMKECGQTFCEEKEMWPWPVEK
jgi:hypothetical protein